MVIPHGAEGSPERRSTKLPTEQDNPASDNKNKRQKGGRGTEGLAKKCWSGDARQTVKASR